MIRRTALKIYRRSADSSAGAPESVNEVILDEEWRLLWGAGVTIRTNRSAYVGLARPEWER